MSAVHIMANGRRVLALEAEALQATADELAALYKALRALYNMP